jgi:hypothetical protein
MIKVIRVKTDKQKKRGSVCSCAREREKLEFAFLLPQATSECAYPGLTLCVQSKYEILSQGTSPSDSLSRVSPVERCRMSTMRAS